MRLWKRWQTRRLDEASVKLQATLARQSVPASVRELAYVAKVSRRHADYWLDAWRSANLVERGWRGNGADRTAVYLPTTVGRVWLNNRQVERL